MDSQQIPSRLRALTSSFSVSQLITLALTFVLVIAVVGGSAFWLNKPTYALLFADMDGETMGQVVTRLKTLKVPYQLDEGGRGIRVPVGRVDELRLELTAQGLPASGRIGFEIFDRTAFGATEFLEKVNYRRALEGEIARTVATLSEVASARVHIAMGREVLFGEPRPSTASVVLKLRDGSPLSPSTVNGITNLVAASVEGLKPESVVILDSYGRPLVRPKRDDGDPMGAAHLERQQNLEREMAARVTALLEPVIGGDRVRVNVALTLNPQSQEETQETWDPNTVVRSRQVSADTATAGTLAATVAGTRSNLPPTPNEQPPAAAPVSAGPNSTRNTETTNFEVSRTTRRTIQPPGEVARLSVAVILDDDHVAKTENGTTQMTRVPRSREELQKIQGLVAAAVGLNMDRGDQLTVENVSFEEPIAEDVEAPSVLLRYAPQIQDGARVGAVLLIAVLTLIFVIRPMIRRLAPVASATLAVAQPTMQRARTVAEMENEIEAQLDAAVAGGSLPGRRLPVLTRRVAAASQAEPENVAKLLRSWMTEAER